MMFVAVAVAPLFFGVVSDAVQFENSVDEITLREWDPEEWDFQSEHYNLQEWLSETGQLVNGKPHGNAKQRIKDYLREAGTVNRVNASAGINFCMNGKLAPEFFLIGAQKASTSSFAAEFFNSPAVVHPTFFNHDTLPDMHMKELHIFDEQARFDRGQTWWLNHYPTCTHARRLISVDMTPNYMLEPKAPARMARWYGEHAARLKFMVLLRDPVSRMQSAFYHGKVVHWCGTEYVGITFQEYTRRFVSEHEVDAEAAWLRWSSHCTAVRGSAYAQQIKLWFTTFSSQQFTIVPSAFQTDRSLTPYGRKTVAKKMFEVLGIPGSAQDAASDCNVHAHPPLERDLPPELLSKLQKAIYHHTGPKTVAAILHNSDAFLYGFPKAIDRSIPHVTYWLREHW